MTFVLGLVADPIPPSYLNAPGPDRMAVIKGRKVIEKFNCNGCHIIQPGVYEFKRNNDTLVQMNSLYDREIKPKAEEEYKFPDHLAWHGRPQISAGSDSACSARAALLNSKRRLSMRRM